MGAPLIEPVQPTAGLVVKKTRCPQRLYTAKYLNSLMPIGIALKTSLRPSLLGENALGTKISATANAVMAMVPVPSQPLGVLATTVKVVFLFTVATGFWIEASLKPTGGDQLYVVKPLLFTSIAFSGMG